LKYFFQISYRGTNYHGWQRQLSAISVQQVIEDTMSKVLRQDIIVTGCGRTDTGVHASQYFFDTVIQEYPEYDLVWRLNKVLPDDISILSAIPVEIKTHARYDAISRSYAYYFHTQKNPFVALTSTLVDHDNLGVEMMQAALDLIMENNDFRSFCKTPDHHNTTICHITYAQLSQVDKGRFKIDITANRYLRSMIRIIAHRVIEVGSGKLSLSELRDYFNKGNDTEQIVMAPPQGLFLTEVVYPFDTV